MTLKPIAQSRGETAVKLIGSKIFLKALVSRQLTAEEGGLILLKRIYIYRLSCFLHFLSVIETLQTLQFTGAVTIG